MPFIQRGCYNHLKGCLKGELYCLFDICIGKDLLFETSLQATLPDSLKKRSIAVFRITDVDEEVKKKYLYDGKKRNEVEQDMMSYETKLVDEKIKIACKIRGKVLCIRTSFVVFHFFDSTNFDTPGFLKTFEKF